jgi:hypothetical protein
MFPHQEPCVRDFMTRCDCCISSWNLLHTAWSGNIVNRKLPRGGGFFRSICLCLFRPVCRSLSLFLV